MNNFNFNANNVLCTCTTFFQRIFITIYDRNGATLSMNLSFKTFCVGGHVIGLKISKWLLLLLQAAKHHIVSSVVFTLSQLAKVFTPISQCSNWYVVRRICNSINIWHHIFSFVVCTWLLDRLCKPYVRWHTFKNHMNQTYYN